MSLYLQHHRLFCEQLAHLHEIGVSWDERGSMPLRRKALQAALEFFGQRPDLALATELNLVRGGLDVGLFRDGRDVRIQFCASGTFVLSAHRPRQRPDVLISGKLVTRALVREVCHRISHDTGVPTLDVQGSDDVGLQDPFSGFVLLRLIPGAGPGECRLLIGRETLMPDLYAFQDVIDLPEDLYDDQLLSGGARLRTLIEGYRRDRLREAEPA